MVLRQEDYSDRAREALTRSQQAVLEYRHTQWDAEHLLFGLLMLEGGTPALLIEKLGAGKSRSVKADVEEALMNAPKYAGQQASQIFATPRIQRVLDEAKKEAKRLKDEYITPEHLLLALTQENQGQVASIFLKNGITQEGIYKALQDIRGSTRVTDPRPEDKYQALQKYSVDITQMARDGKIDPVIGRDTEINRVMQVLSRRTKNNPVLIGEAGVGKTAIAEGLALRIVAGSVPGNLQRKKVISLQMTSLIAGAKFRGEFEERLKSVMDEIASAAGTIVLFIDEIHTVVGAGAGEGSVDASNIMKPALAKGEMQTIGATTPSEYRKYIESDSALERRFSPVWVEEPDVSTAIDMLKILKKRYEQHHNIKIQSEAIEAAVKLSARYITGRQLPDKAIDLMDEAAAKVRLSRETLPKYIKDMADQIQNLAYEESEASGKSDYERAAQTKAVRLRLEEEYTAKKQDWERESKLPDSVTAEVIATLISERTNIPVTRLVEAERMRLVNLESRLRQRVIGQEAAVTAVADAVRRARVGLKEPKKPIGSFIFLGPTGVGKTELARSLAEFLFDDEENMVRIDMSEYQEKHTVSRLIGAPPGYVGYGEGGQLTEVVRRRPFSVILFDEIEKAHPEIFNLLLQVLDDGRLTDAQGRTVDFRNTLVIMTSNIGSDIINTPQVGFANSNSVQNNKKIKSQVEDSLKTFFRPEFLNRVDEIVIFELLEEQEILKIVEKLLREVTKRINILGINLNSTQPALKWIAQNGFNQMYGARPLKRTIQQHIENPISMKILSGEITKGDTIVVDKNQQGLTFITHANKAS